MASFRRTSTLFATETDPGADSGAQNVILETGAQVSQLDKLIL